VTRVEFHPEAQRELIAAVRYYEQYADNLGVDFISAVETACAHLERFPESGRPFGNRLRRFLVPRFPYGVLYQVAEGRIRVVAVANLRRKPGYWRDRA
jgi:plasmid stabilization system protein ParE